MAHWPVLQRADTTGQCRDDGSAALARRVDF